MTYQDNSENNMLTRDSLLQDEGVRIMTQEAGFDPLNDKDFECERYVSVMTKKKTIDDAYIMKRVDEEVLSII